MRSTNPSPNLNPNSTHMCLCMCVYVCVCLCLIYLLTPGLTRGGILYRTRHLARCSCRVCVSVSGVLFSVGVCSVCVLT